MERSVTCVIVTYNSEKWLHKALAGVVAQTYAVGEILVADDGSADGTREIVAAWEGKDARIRKIFRERNLGTSANRDLAIREARGDFVATLDGDDFYYPSKIQAEMGLVARHGERCVACSSLRWVDGEGDVLRALEFERINSMSRRELLAAFVLRAFPLPRDMLFSKRLYLDSGGFDHEARLYEDWDFKLRLFRAGGLWKAENVPGVAWRRHDGGGSNISPEDHLYWTLNTIYKNRPWLEAELGREFMKKAVLARFAPLVQNPVRDI